MSEAENICPLAEEKGGNPGYYCDLAEKLYTIESRLSQVETDIKWVKRLLFMLIPAICYLALIVTKLGLF